MDTWELIESYFNDIKRWGDEWMPRGMWWDDPPAMQIAKLQDAWRKIQ